MVPRWLKNLNFHCRNDDFVPSNIGSLVCTFVVDDMIVVFSP